MVEVSKQRGRRSGRPAKRQRVRRGVQIVMLMLFPATFFYFSPVVSAMGASEGIVAGSLLLMLSVGKRAPCHTICWMAPFMVLGRSVGNALRLPGLRLAADPDACIHCGTCSAACPMSLEVQPMAERGVMDHTDCILCAECIDVCPKSAISYTWKRPVWSGSPGAAARSRAGAVASAAALALFLLVAPSRVGATPAMDAAHRLSSSRK